MTVNRGYGIDRTERIVGQWAARMALEAVGDVLQLGWPEPPRHSRAVTSVRRLRRPCEVDALAPLDTVLSVCELWRPEWGRDQLVRLAGRLRSGGRLLFVEPVAVTGASGLAQRLVDLGTPPGWRRWRFDRVVPDDLRAAGLVPVRIDRVCVDPVGRVRSFVVGAAMCR